MSDLLWCSICGVMSNHKSGAHVIGNAKTGDSDIADGVWKLRTDLAAAQKRIAELEGRTCETCKHNFGPIHYGVGNSVLVANWIVCNKLEHSYKLPFSCSAFEPKKED